MQPLKTRKPNFKLIFAVIATKQREILKVNLSLGICSMLCYYGSLDPKKVKGKLVVCTRGSNAKMEKGEEVIRAGGAGMVLVNSDYTADDTVTADPQRLPETNIAIKEGQALSSYMKSTK